MEHIVNTSMVYITDTDFDYDDGSEKERIELRDELCEKAEDVCGIDFSECLIVYAYDDTRWDGKYNTPISLSLMKLMIAQM